MNAQADPVAPDDPLAELERRRADGAAARDPVRFRIAEALARRATAQQGPARQLIVRRVMALLAEFDAAPQRASSPAPLEAGRPNLAALSGLIDRLGRTADGGAATVPGDARPARQPAPPRPLKTMARFKGTWSRLRADQRLRQALAQVPAMAGPLNSSHLVNRTLQELRAPSPAYLDAFMAHADTLQWLEQASGGDLPATPHRTARKA